MSSNRKSTYTYAPKIVTDDTNSESVKRLEELLKRKAPNASDHPDIHTIIDSSFVVQSPAITVESTTARKSSTNSINEKLNQQYNVKPNQQSSDTVIYSHNVTCTPDNLEEGMKQFEEIHKNRPQPGSGKNVVVNHSFTQTGKTWTLAELMEQLNINKQQPAKANESKEKNSDDSDEHQIGFSIGK